MAPNHVGFTREKQRHLCHILKLVLGWPDHESAGLPPAPPANCRNLRVYGNRSRGPLLVRVRSSVMSRSSRAPPPGRRSANCGLIRRNKMNGNSGQYVCCCLTAMKKERLPCGGQRQPRVVLILIPVRLGPPFLPIAIPHATTPSPSPQNFVRAQLAEVACLPVELGPRGLCAGKSSEHVRQNQLRFSYNMSDEPRDGVIVARLTRCVP